MDINIHEAKTHFSKLIERVLLGEEITIAKAGKPVARLVPIASAAKPRKPGSARGEFSMPKNFNQPLPKSVLKDFHL